MQTTLHAHLRTIYVLNWCVFHNYILNIQFFVQDMNVSFAYFYADTCVFLILGIQFISFVKNMQSTTDVEGFLALGP